MFCTKCGAKNLDTARFCCVCGGELEKPVSQPQQPQYQQPQYQQPRYGQAPHYANSNGARQKDLRREQQNLVAGEWRTMAASPLLLITAILLSLYAVLKLEFIFDGLGAIDKLFELDFNKILVSLGAFLLPISYIVIAIGLWITYAEGFSENDLDIEARGFVVAKYGATVLTIALGMSMAGVLFKYLKIGLDIVFEYAFESFAGSMIGAGLAVYFGASLIRFFDSCADCGIYGSPNHVRVNAGATMLLVTVGAGLIVLAGELNAEAGVFAKVMTNMSIPITLESSLEVEAAHFILAISFVFLASYGFAFRKSMEEAEITEV